MQDQSQAPNTAQAHYERNLAIQRLAQEIYDMPSDPRVAVAMLRILDAWRAALIRHMDMIRAYEAQNARVARDLAEAKRQRRAKCIRIARAAARYGLAEAARRFGLPIYMAKDMAAHGRKLIRAWKRARRDAEIIAMHERGMRASEIAERVGLSYRRVRQIIKQAHMLRQRKLRLLAVIRA